MLRAETGGAGTAPLGSPVEPPATPFAYTAEQLIEHAGAHAPELAMKRKLMEASEKRLSRSRKEVMPDVTLMAKYSSVGGGMEDMYELTASFPLPLFYRDRQAPGINEASWDLAASRSDLEAARVRIAGRILDDLAMVHSAERIGELYRSTLIPNARKGIDAALASFAAGRMEAATALARLKAPFDYELAAWQQRVQREKAIARIRAYTGAMEVP
jgi:outer membrane protein TolC